ncbi:hypothetical protein C2845_PM01G41550 [Panicum miliaceum]|uniref:Myb-like domain-containing protein n=1 Tax=Panicum miliaceum TaxID=4540 RepID=A0A3L6THG1_PANMI|nr:hypothetical protein C2845_PM01G41550 [Panicum miliaceum]
MCIEYAFRLFLSPLEMPPKRNSHEKQIIMEAKLDKLDSGVAQIGKLFGSRNPCTSAGAKKYRSRKHNDHWTEDEMIELVVGTSRRGIGKWSSVKDEYLSTSIRTSVHLKDKWRNLVAACKANTSRKAHKEKNTSTKKFFHQRLQVSVQKATELVVKRFGHRILAMEAKHLAQKKK